MILESQEEQQEEGRDLCPFFLSPEEEEEDLDARSVLCLVEVEEQCGSQGFLDSNAYIEDCIKVEVEATDDDDPPCIVLNIAPECSQTPWWGCNHHGNTNGDDPLIMQKIFQRQSSLKTEKAAGETESDSLNKKWKTYRRVASFDSRKIIIVFSVMSSLGTLILIYLTLRVRMNDDVYAHTS